MAIRYVFVPDPSADSALSWVVLAVLGWQAVTMVGAVLFNLRRYGVTAPGWEAP